jgi:hypothetical protein
MAFHIWSFLVYENDNYTKVNIPYEVCAGPGSSYERDDLIIAETADEAAQKFVRAIENDPSNGGWEGPPIEFGVYVATQGSCDIPVGEMVRFRYNPPSSVGTISRVS